MRLAAVLLLSALFTGCTELEVRDVYVASTTRMDRVAFSAGQDARLTLRFEDATRFYAAGLLGVPLIPSVSKGHRDDIVLEARLRLNRPLDYSVMAAPCLLASTGPICPRLTHVGAQLERPGPGHEDWQGQPAATTIPGLAHLELNATQLPASGRLESADLELGFHYFGEPPWVSGTIYVIYTFACPGQCPDEFDLAVDDLVVAGESLRPRGTVHFTRTTVRDYRTAPVQ